MSFAETPAVRIDVLIPAYNVASTIVAAVGSMQQQTLADIRIVVVNDGSTDDTGARLAELAAADPRLVVITQANGGIVDALNTGLKICTAEYIARHDGDDVAFPDRLEKQLAYLDAHPDCVAVGANAHHIDGTGQRIGTGTNIRNPDWADADWFPAGEPYLMHPLLLVRRQALVGIGGYRHVFHAEDADLYWRLQAVGRLHNMPEFLADYRIHADSISGRSVVNGRVQAVNSQLAAVSQKRRNRGVADLAFPAGRLRQFVEARSIQGMVGIAEEALEAAERPAFRLAVAAKLLEFESYRPYDLEPEDRRFVKEAIVSNAGLLSPDNLADLRKRQAKYVAKLLTRGKAGDAAELVQPSLVWPITSLVSKFVLRKLHLSTAD